MVFCNNIYLTRLNKLDIVTILILVDGFLQYEDGFAMVGVKNGHNPYFSRWFSAIGMKKMR